MPKRSAFTVGELVKVLQVIDPGRQVRVWDLGYGDHVPLMEVEEGQAFVILDGATKQEMELLE